MATIHVLAAGGAAGIANAITAASPGDTILYEDGVDYSPFVVSKANLTIECTTRPGVSVGINAKGASNLVSVTAAGCTLRYFKAYNCAGVKSSLISGSSAAAGLTLDHCHLYHAVNGYCVTTDGDGINVDYSWFQDGGQLLRIRSNLGSSVTRSLFEDANTMIVDTASPTTDDTGGNPIVWEKGNGDISHVHLLQGCAFLRAGSPHSYDYDIDGGMWEVFDTPYVQIIGNSALDWLGTLWEIGVHPSGTRDYGSSAVVNPSLRQHLPGLKIIGNYCSQRDNTQILGNTGVLHTVQRGGMIIRVGDNMQVQGNRVAGCNFWSFVLGRHDAYYAGPLSGLDISGNDFASTLGDIYHLRWALDPVAEPPPWTIANNNVATSIAYGMRHEPRGAWTPVTWPTTGSNVTYATVAAAANLLGASSDTWQVSNGTAATDMTNSITADAVARDASVRAALKAQGVIPGGMRPKFIVRGGSKMIFVGGAPKVVSAP